MMPDIIAILSGIAGIVGAIAGITSLVQVKKIKSLDLRMERGRLLNVLQVGFEGLVALSDKANQSKTSLLAAQGLSQSGTMQKWKTDFEKNKKAIQGLSEKISAFKVLKAFGEQLETHILELHLIEEQIKSLTSDFNTSLAEDNMARDTLIHMKFKA